MSILRCSLWVIITFSIITSCYSVRSGRESAVSTAPMYGEDRYVRVSMGFTQACALKKSGAIVCWGDFEDGTPVPRIPGTFVDIDAGYLKTCAIRTDGSRVCWGGGDTRWPASRMEEKYIQLAAGHMINCGVLTDHTVHCWIGTERFTFASPEGMAEVTVGMEHVCMRTMSGRVACYGPNAPGCFTAPEGSFRQIDTNPYPAFNMQVCGIRDDNSIQCWGYDRYEETGEETVAADQRTKADIRTVRGGAIGAQARFQHGQAGYQQAESIRSQPGHVAHDLRADAMTLGSSLMALGLVQPLFYSMFKDRVKEYGLNNPPQGQFKQVAVNGPVNCGLRFDGTLACWGIDCKNREGLCDPPPLQFTHIAMGASCGCGVMTDGRIACWGADVAGVCTPP